MFALRPRTSARQPRPRYAVTGAGECTDIIVEHDWLPMKTPRSRCSTFVIISEFHHFAKCAVLTALRAASRSSSQTARLGGFSVFSNRTIQNLGRRVAFLLTGSINIQKPYFLYFYLKLCRTIVQNKTLPAVYSKHGSAHCRSFAISAVCT